MKTLRCKDENTGELLTLPIESIHLWIGRGVHGIGYLEHLARDHEARPKSLFPVVKDGDGYILRSHELTAE